MAIKRPETAEEWFGAIVGSGILLMAMALLVLGFIKIFQWAL